MNVVSKYSDNILKMISEVLELSGDMVTPEKNFQDIGMNSIGFINVIIKCETEFDIEFEDDKFLMTSFPTIGDFIEYVESLVL
ncbi:acyl carrier protein [Anaerosporobacter faecicola]|uniref:acyl carrier protein n=1 Tax=Anaerosporobacter faecicola TaxID=2718714 RepID=UPI00143A7576|nr:acyl carrier protein [Anaerosporobacter faecicola]